MKTRSKLHLPCKPPFDWPFFLRYLGGRCTPGVEAVQGEVYVRAIAVADEIAVLRVEHKPLAECLVVSLEGGMTTHRENVLSRVRRLFDLDAPMGDIHRLLGADPWLRPMLESAPGIRVPGAWSAFELISRAIVGQQVSVKAATTIMGRIAARFGEPIPPNSAGIRYLFPSPAKLADADLRNIGMPSKRVAALQNLARAIAEKAIPFSDCGTTPGDIRTALLAQPGIGPWTVEYFALRALRDPNAWPGTDLVLQRALQENGREKWSNVQLRRFAGSWQPWRGYVAMHLWNRAASTKKQTAAT